MIFVGVSYVIHYGRFSDVFMIFFVFFFLFFSFLFLSWIVFRYIIRWYFEYSSIYNREKDTILGNVV